MLQMTTVRHYSVPSWHLIRMKTKDKTLATLAICKSNGRAYNYVLSCCRGVIVRSLLFSTVLKHTVQSIYLPSTLSSLMFFFLKRGRYEKEREKHRKYVLCKNILLYFDSTVCVFVVVASRGRNYKSTHKSHFSFHFQSHFERVSCIHLFTVVWLISRFDTEIMWMVDTCGLSGR